MKHCTKCGEEKELAEFYKNRNKRDGYSSECKNCSLAYRQTERGKAMHKHHRQTEKYKATRKRYLICHPEYKKARNVISNAIAAGKLPLPNTMQCHYGNHQAEQYHHYLGYAPEHRLDVIPVCLKCHKK